MENSRNKKKAVLSSVNTYLKTAARLTKEENYAEAKLLYEHALNIAPGLIKAKVLNNYATLFLQQGLFFTGISLLEQAKTIAPTSTSIQKNLVKAYYKLAKSYHEKSVLYHKRCNDYTKAYLTASNRNFRNK